MSGVARVLFVLLAMGVSACHQAPAGARPISQAELAQRIQEGKAPLVLDVRSAEEYQAGHIQGAINIAHNDLPGGLSELEISESDEIVVHCESGRRAAIAETVLVEAGYSGVRDLEGHMQAWRAAGLPTE